MPLRTSDLVNPEPTLVYWSSAIGLCSLGFPGVRWWLVHDFESSAPTAMSTGSLDSMLLWLFVRPRMRPLLGE